MSVNVRIIPRLDIKGPHVVKGIHLEGWRVVGRPDFFAHHYAQMGADELVFMDVVASLFERNSILETVRSTAASVFIPLTVGGGLRSLDDIRDALRSGADKVALNTAAIRDSNLLREASLEFGSSTIVVAIEAKSREPGRWEAYIDCGRERTGRDVADWAEEAVALGAGEILLTSVDREGTGQGYDMDLVKTVTERVSVPVIAHGGAGMGDHVSEAGAVADALCMGSMLHYCLLDSEPELEEFTARHMGKGWRGDCMSISGVKGALTRADIACRQVPELGSGA